MPLIDLRTVAYSRAGSWLKVVPAGRDARRCRLATCRMLPANATWGEQRPTHEFFDLVLLRGEAEVPYAAAAEPYVMSFTPVDASSSARPLGELTFLDRETILVRAAPGVAVRLAPTRRFPVARRFQAHHVDSVYLSDYESSDTLQVRALRACRVDASSKVDPDHPVTVLPLDPKRPLELGVRVDRGGALWAGGKVPEFDQAATRLDREWRTWLKRRPQVQDRYAASADVAWYQLWNAIAGPDQAMTRRGILMSKHWMNQVWSWDNCFTALAVAGADVGLALDQLRLFFDHQLPTGAFPDAVNPLIPRYGFVKPPIFGWTILGLIDRVGLPAMRPFLREAYEPLVRNAGFWSGMRNMAYLHGNDSGWDNSTAFDHGFPTEGADLVAHMAMTYEALGVIAKAIGKRADAGKWNRKAQQQLARLRKRHVGEDGRLFSPRAGALSAAPSGSLLNSIPAMLGPRLPTRVLDAIAEDLRPGGPFLTKWGLATERPDSPNYKPDGYWRGPIWAPSTYLIVTGLAAAGRTDLARTIAERFCDLCATDNGFWENYDALTGAGLCCPAYTWTPAVFLMLAEWLEDNAVARRSPAS